MVSHFSWAYEQQEHMYIKTLLLIVWILVLCVRVYFSYPTRPEEER